MGVMRATFVGADLTGADLSGANLYKADFSHADLTAPSSPGPTSRMRDLVQTDLQAGRRDRGPSWPRPNIEGANFRGAIGRSRIQGLDQARNRDKAIFDAK